MAERAHGAEEEAQAERTGAAPDAVPGHEGGDRPVDQRTALQAARALGRARHARPRGVPHGHLLSLQQVAGNAVVQRLAEGGDAAAGGLDPGLAERIEARRGGGRPLGGPARDRLEGALDVPLDAVRIHDDTGAGELSRAIGARAFTVGQDVFARPGALGGDAAGRRTLAHEVAHTVQQGPAAGTPTGVSTPGDPHERAADAVAEAADEHATGSHSGAVGPGSGGAAPVDPASAGAAVMGFWGDDEPPKTGIDRVKEILAEWWVGPLAEYELESLWSDLGPDAADRHTEEFDASIEHGMDPDNLGGAGRIEASFTTDVEHLALDYLRGNEAELEAEAERLGLGAGPPSEVQEAHLEQVQEAVGQVQDLRGLIEDMKAVQVGYRVQASHVAVHYQPVTFEPGSPPQVGLKGDEERPARSYPDLMEDFEKVSAAIMLIADQYPSVYAALAEDRLDELEPEGDDVPPDPRVVLREVHASVNEDIAATRQSVLSGDLDVEALRVLHGQLMEGEARAGTRTDWTHPWNKAIAADLVEDYEELQLGIDIGVGLACAVAFIAAELATAGLATGLLVAGGVGLGAANASRKWETYGDLTTAAGAGTSSETELVSDAQARAALVDAVIETVFAGLDAIGAVGRGVRGYAALRRVAAGRRAAEGAGGVSDLRRLAELNPDEVAQAITQGIDELGVEGAAKAAGTDADGLLARLPDDAPAAERIRSYQRLAREGVAADDLRQALDTVIERGVYTQGGRELPVEQVVGQAVDQLGFRETLKAAGGWKRLSSALGPSSDVGRRFKAWRDAVYDDLADFVETLRQPGDPERLVKETGTLTDVTNDLDMSFLGPRASEYKAKAAQFLAGRTGLAEDPATLDKMLYIGLFTDPRRMHLFDELPELQERLARRTMKFEEQLIWNDEYTRLLREAADDPAAAEAAEEVAREMDALGVTRIPGFEPLSRRAVDVLSAEADRLHAAIDAAKRAGDTGQLESLVEQLANVQAQINVKEGGGYFSAGGVRRFVTEKESFPTAWGGERLAETGAHDLGAALDQVNKLRDAMRKVEQQAILDAGSRDPAELAAAIKSVGKYGDRFHEAARAVQSELRAPMFFDDTARQFQELIAQARGRTAESLQEALARDAEGVIARTREAFEQYDVVHTEVLKTLKARAGLEGIGDLAEEITRATRLRYRFLVAKSTILHAMGSTLRAAGIPVRVVAGGGGTPEAATAGAATAGAATAHAGTAGATADQGAE